MDGITQLVNLRDTADAALGVSGNPLYTTGVGTAGEAHLGQVGGEATLVDVTLVCDTSIYADGDVLSDRVVVTGALRVANGTGILQSVLVLDEDDQGVAMDLYFFNADVTLGTINAAPSISDANARNLLGRVRINAADYDDLGGVRQATAPPSQCGFLLKSVTGLQTIYVAAVTRGGTPTYTASGVKLRIGILQN